MFVINRRRALAGASSLLLTPLAQNARANAQTLAVASFPSFDDAVKAAVPLYRKVAPNVTLRLSSLAYADHHSAMVTALATGAGLPDVIGIEHAYLGRLIDSGGLEDLSKPPYDGLSFRGRIVPFAFAQASRRDGALSAIPADLGPGSLFYRQDIVAKAGVTEAQLTSSWESFVEAGKQIKARTGALLVPNANTLLRVITRSDVPAGEGIYFDRNDKPLLNTPRFEKAFTVAREVRRHQLDPSGAFAAWGGSFYGIPRRLPEERKRLAWEFIRFMTTNREMQLAAFKNLDAYPALIEAARDPFGEPPRPHRRGGVRERAQPRARVGQGHPAGAGRCAAPGRAPRAPLKAAR